MRVWLSFFWLIIFTFCNFWRTNLWNSETLPARATCLDRWVVKTCLQSDRISSYSIYISRLEIILLFWNRLKNIKSCKFFSFSITIFIVEVIEYCFSQQVQINIPIKKNHFLNISIKLFMCDYNIKFQFIIVEFSLRMNFWVSDIDWTYVSRSFSFFFL